ncbi:small multidrug efflux protein [Herbiconiux sp. CPCC 203407]|uniref:Small multidrug efflux protein n=1 Tax=Herbiconiux oxytropis TaxID=2970915 RepID=A0AA41XFU4_9MICO|nr:small multidrug efflux protein [Herbiconiux oxytropis]MCS5723930.1 small multidrug efflux protein [Herbiconiux oxytropis]MCS5725414.1 small multidrug efflux protein [Herbiconiux oxytropis]
MDNPYGWLQDAIDQVPEIVQPLIVALAGAVPYIEAEGATAFGILAGLDPVVAAIAGAAGNILCVVLVVLLGSRVREGVLARRATTATARAQGDATVLVAEAPETEPEAEPEAKSKGNRRTKGRQRLRRWLVKFGVPGASLLAPLALPTMLTAAFFVGSGVPKRWVILWQVVAIAVWTTLVALAATGALALLGW